MKTIYTIKIRFIHFNFKLVEKFEDVQTFQLIEINFRFVENVNVPVITLYNLLISRNRIQLVIPALIKFYSPKNHQKAYIIRLNLLKSSKGLYNSLKFV